MLMVAQASLPMSDCITVNAFVLVITHSGESRNPDTPLLLDYVLQRNGNIGIKM